MQNHRQIEIPPSLSRMRPHVAGAAAARPRCLAAPRSDPRTRRAPPSPLLPPRPQPRARTARARPPSSASSRAAPPQPDELACPPSQAADDAGNAGRASSVRSRTPEGERRAENGGRSEADGSEGGTHGRPWGCCRRSDSGGTRRRGRYVGEGRPGLTREARTGRPAGGAGRRRGRRWAEHGWSEAAGRRAAGSFSASSRRAGGQASSPHPHLFLLHTEARGLHWPLAQSSSLLFFIAEGAGQQQTNFSPLLFLHPGSTGFSLS